MSRRHLIYFLLGGAITVGMLAAYLSGTNLAVLQPKGLIAGQQRDLIVIATLLMLIIVIPVFILTFAFAWKYRASNTKATYKPDWDHHAGLELAWWAIPCLVILVLAVITWRSSHELDPFKPLASDKRPVTVQVVALPWKWLFIYPEHGIATVNYVEFPEQTPVNFMITADAPMNSFWIPELGGQVYAMAGMSTKLHLMADQSGSYTGSSANLSGEGFSGMKFVAKSSSQADFDRWVGEVRGTNGQLMKADYSQLAKPSKNVAPIYFSAVEPNLYDDVVSKYMDHQHAR